MEREIILTLYSTMQFARKKSDMDNQTLSLESRDIYLQNICYAYADGTAVMYFLLKLEYYDLNYFIKSAIV